MRETKKESRMRDKESERQQTKNANSEKYDRRHNFAFDVGIFITRIKSDAMRNVALPCLIFRKFHNEIGQNFWLVNS